MHNGPPTANLFCAYCVLEWATKQRDVGGDPIIARG